MGEELISEQKSESTARIAQWVRAILVISAFAFSTFLAALAYEGFFTRYLADDFCYANSALHQGVLQGFSTIYLTWSGRFSTILLTQLGATLGSSLPAVLPVLYIIFLVVSLFWIFHHGLQIRNQALSRIKAVFLVLIVIFFFFLMTPSRYQILDWMNGSITYTLPLIFLTLLTTWFLRTIRYDDMPQNFMTFFGIFLLALVGAGFSETTTALQITMLVLAILLSLFRVRKKKKWKAIRWQLIGLAGSLIGMLIMILAPGNKVRQALLPIPPSVSTVLFLSFKYSLDFLVDLLRTKPLPTLVLFLTSFLIGFLTSHYQREESDNRPALTTVWRFILIPPVVFLPVASICAPSVYAESAYPESRALSAGVFVFVIGVALLGIQFSNLISHLTVCIHSTKEKIMLLISLAILLVICIYPVRATIKLIPEIQTTQKFAVAWDQRGKEIRQSVAKNILTINAQAINSQHGIQEVDTDPNGWVNQCVAEYYGLKSITAH
jgi:hypothetical protein